MKIASSNIAMASTSNQKVQHTRNESLRYWVGDQRPNFKSNDLTRQLNRDKYKEANLQISDEAKKLLQSQDITTQAVSDELSMDLSDQDKIKIRMLEEMLYTLTGKKVKLKIPEKIKIRNVECEIQNIKQENQAQQTTQKGWGLEYDLIESYHEKQKMTFSSNGVVKTSDGREIKFSVDLNMSREFYEHNEIHIRAGDAQKDPLVINFDGAGATLTEKKYSFDIDVDGTNDQISFVGKGSGFLAIDKNNDGQINDGSELFGPATNDGFAELAEYDSDKNGWVDENDPIFENLKIWTKDDQGNDLLFAIGQKGIGAIYLGSVSSSFELKDGQNNSLGTIRSTGIYLKEDGKAGTIQHLDLTI